MMTEIRGGSAKCNELKFVCLFVFGATAPSGQGLLMYEVS